MSAYPANVTATLDAYDDRRLRCLRAVADHPVPPRSTYGSHIYGVPAIANLALDRDVAACNAQLREVAAWYDLPHPTGRDHRGEPDFVAMKLCLASHHPTLSGHLEPATREAIQRFFLTQRFDSKYGSENHVLIFRVSRYLMAQSWPTATFAAYGATGADLVVEDGGWLADFLRFRAERGWGEFDSACYIVPDWEAHSCLHDYAADPELRRLTGMMLDLLLADMAVDSLAGMYCGAHGRIYPEDALDHFTEHAYPLQYLYFGLGDPACAHRCLIDAALSSYRPHPLVVDIALNRPTPYVNRERKHLHRMSDIRPIHPLDGSIRKYTYYTPAYVLGCVQYQDPYPPDSGDDANYAHHQQHQWDLTIGPRTDTRLFTHHPGDNKEHNYWTGDLGCRCGHFFQHQTVVLALYDIPPAQPHAFIHAYLPRAAFDEVRDLGRIIAVRAGHVFAALRFVHDCEWVRHGEFAQREVISRQTRTGAVCEVGDTADFATFDRFCTEIQANTLDFDPVAMSMTYHSSRAGTIHLDTCGTRTINGATVDLDYPTYDCPYMHAAWQSGLIDLRHGDRRRALDFRAPTRDLDRL